MKGGGIVLFIVGRYKYGVIYKQGISVCVVVFVLIWVVFLCIWRYRNFYNVVRVIEWCWYFIEQVFNIGFNLWAIRYIIWIFFNDDGFFVNEVYVYIEVVDYIVRKCRQFYIMVCIEKEVGNLVDFCFGFEGVFFQDQVRGKNGVYVIMEVVFFVVYLIVGWFYGFVNGQFEVLSDEGWNFIIIWVLGLVVDVICDYQVVYVIVVNCLGAVVLNLDGIIFWVQYFNVFQGNVFGIEVI